MSIDISEYKALYFQTGYELITTMKTSLIALRTNMCDETAIAEFHRAVHSLKSQSLVMGYTRLGLLNKSLEALFRAIKERRECVTIAMLDQIQKIVVTMHESLSQIENNQGELDVSKEIQELSQLTSISLI